jgi:hypothetical protein
LPAGPVPQQLPEEQLLFDAFVELPGTGPLFNTCSKMFSISLAMSSKAEGNRRIWKGN